MMLRAYVFVLLLIPVLSGCAAVNSIHRTSSIPASREGVYEDGNLKEPEKRAAAKVVTVDAKQRHLLISPNDARSLSGWRVCAEAAPDIFSAYASSMGGELGVNKEGGKGNFSAAIAEAAATIERTQTVNLLRESMYRTCERYLSGALTEDQFIIQAARDQKSMVAVLAIEQLTGAIRPRSTVITGPATMAAHFSGEEAAKLIKDSMAGRDTARAKAEAAKLALEQAKEAGVCDPVPEAGEEGEAAESKADPAKCQELTSQAQSAEEALAKAETALADATKLAANLSTGGTASTVAGAVHTDAVDRDDFDSAAIEYVASAVTAIATSPLIDESLMYCIGRLTSGTGNNSSRYSPPYGLSEEDKKKWTDMQLQNDRQCVEIIKLDIERKNIALKEARARTE